MYIIVKILSSSIGLKFKLRKTKIDAMLTNNNNYYV